MSDEAVPTLDEMRAWLHKWGDENRCFFQAHGECGFGRPCVGMIATGHYIDYGGYTSFDPPTQIEGYDSVRNKVCQSSPEDAYHKDDCLAVLVHGDDYDEATRQLYEWVKGIDAAGLTVEIQDRQSSGYMDVLIHGPRQPRLIERAEATVTLRWRSTSPRFSACPFPTTD
jgi:hypothetical protein